MHRDRGEVLEAVGIALRSTRSPLFLAVSGGLDSMVLLDAAMRVAPERVAAVGTFDHGTGQFAREAVAHVATECAARGARFVSATTGDFHVGSATEDGWRRARLAFLRHHATQLGAPVVTAHHADDQAETVLMRVLRGSGARGLAGLLAPTEVLRPFLEISRATLAEYALQRDVHWVADPSNDSRRHLRNRIRRDLLPALTARDPALRESLLAIGRDSRRLRDDLDFLAQRISTVADGAVSVPAGELAGLDPDSLSMLWSALAARVGLALDRRGIARLASFCAGRPRRGSIQLSGGWCMEAGAGVYLLRKARPPLGPATELPAAGSLDWGGFRFTAARVERHGDAWVAAVPAGSRVRAWEAGDRLEPGGRQRVRRVKRWLSDAGVRGEDRRGWPVVVAGEDVVWIPGVRRSDAATERSGRPVRHYVCERTHR